MPYKKTTEYIFRLAAAYVRYFPIHRGKGIVVRLLDNGNFPGFQTITNSKDGRAFVFDSETRHGYQIFFYGDREKAETDLMRKVVREGDTVIDIGANIGWYTTLFASCVGESGVVLAIEPIPSTFDVLRQNLKLNHNEANVKLFHGVCSDSIGELEVHYFPTLHPGLASSRPIGDQPSVTFVVPATTVDNLIQLNQLDHITMMKIDVEGAELSVLKGSLNALRNGLVESLLIEANDERSEAFSYQFCECIDLLKDAQQEYETFRVNHRTGALDQMRSSTDYRHGDNIFVVMKGGEVWKRLNIGQSI